MSRRDIRKMGIASFVLEGEGVEGKRRRMEKRGRRYEMRH